MLKLVHISEADKGIYISEARRKKTEKLKTEHARLLSLAAEQAYNEVSIKLTGRIIPYTYDENGKPKNNSFFFSISHSGEYAVCAAAQNPVGVDIQHMREVNLELAKRFFAADEFDYVKNGDNIKERFFEIWTKKEAYVKLYGMGIGADFSDFSVLSECGVNFKMYDISEEYKLCKGTAAMPPTPVKCF